MRKLTKSTTIVAGAALALTVGLMSIGAAPEGAEAGPKASKAWRKLAGKLRKAERAELKCDLLIDTVRASLFTDEEEREEELEDIKDDFKEEKGLVNDIYQARLELAVLLGEDEIYAVDIDKDDFVEGVNHPFLPLTVGTTWTYKAETEDGEEIIVVTVLDETKKILGIDCTVVRDTVTIDGELVEDTHDWFAQDKDGNVWYMGEIAVNYEDGQIEDIDGSFQAGEEGAQPGIIMPAVPTVGQVFRQEFYVSEAEDWAEILSLGESATVPFGSFTNCIKTFDSSTLEPDAQENKFYAQGVGVVLEIDIESGERVELISVTTETK